MNSSDSYKDSETLSLGQKDIIKKMKTLKQDYKTIKHQNKKILPDGWPLHRLRVPISPANAGSINARKVPGSPDLFSLKVANE